MNFARFFPWTKWRQVIPVSQVVPGKVQVRSVMGHAVGVGVMDDCIYVFDGLCPHAGQSLDGEEIVQPGIIECARHKMLLSLDKLPCSANVRPVRRLPFRVRDGVIEADRDGIVR